MSYIIYSSDKTPLSPYTGAACNPHDPANRSDRATAETAVLLGLGVGVGLVFTPDSGRFFLDIDHCLTPTGWSEQAVALCQQFTGCYIEVSKSGTGLHIIGAGTLPPGHRTRAVGLELYTSGRYCALTGGTGSMDHPAQEALTALYEAHFKPLESNTAPAEWTDGPVPEWNGPTDDKELVLRMTQARGSIAAALGGKLSIEELWRGEGGDASAGDQSLCNHLAFWTGKDCERMERIFGASGRSRDKWTEREDYRRTTILKAVAACQTVYGAPRESAPPGEPVLPPPPPGGEWRSGLQILTLPLQVEHFDGCVYVRDLHRVLVPDGALLKPEQFRVSYGGYEFTMAADGGGKTTKNAWEAFTESRGYCFPKADGTCFRPELPATTLVREEGRVLVNTYVPVETERRCGDASKFIGHVERLLPDAGDRAILLAYMAAVVQHPGIKFQWAPLLQGMEGNGKTLLFSCVAAAVGHRYTHLPSAQDISNKFNAWLAGKLFIGVEEIYTSDRQEVVDTLKTLITNGRVEIQAKGADQTTADNRANFMLSSNHMDAVRKTETDRRYCVFYTAQQEPDDMARCGMTGGYFPDLYRWLRLEGYAIVNDYLRAYQIPDSLNPAVDCHRAPVTTSTAAAVRLSLGSVEQEVQEAIEQGRPGFAGGWISSIALDRLLEERRMSARVPRNKRRAMLQALGYDYHPHLADGRVNNALPEGGRPRLFVKRGHLACNMRLPAEIARVYIEAQNSPAGMASGRAFGVV